MKMTRKAKVSLAKRMRTQEELKARKSIWDTKYWNARKEKNRVKSQHSSDEESKRQEG